MEGISAAKDAKKPGKRTLCACLDVPRDRNAKSHASGATSLKDQLAIICLASCCWLNGTLLISVMDLDMRGEQTT